jgi:hypothetical protein
MFYVSITIQSSQMISSMCEVYCWFLTFSFPLFTVYFSATVFIIYVLWVLLQGTVILTVE